MGQDLSAIYLLHTATNDLSYTLIALTITCFLQMNTTVIHLKTNLVVSKSHFFKNQMCLPFSRLTHPLISP